MANLNMEVKDLDTAPNAVFEVNLVGGDPNNKFAVEPRKATGHTAVSLKVNSQNLDYENANERKFLLLGKIFNINWPNIGRYVQNRPFQKEPFLLYNRMTFHMVDRFIDNLKTFIVVYT